MDVIIPPHPTPPQLRETLTYVVKMHKNALYGKCVQKNVCFQVYRATNKDALDAL